MTGVIKGRYTAETKAPVVVFLIGMRINKLWKIWKWLPVARAMPRMLREVAQDDASGFLGWHFWRSGRNIMTQQYWRSFDDLLRYAHAKDSAHFPAWRAFNQAVAGNGDVGIWHETYLIEPGKFECVYGNMPRFGLAAATAHVPATGRLAEARDRMRA